MAADVVGAAGTAAAVASGPPGWLALGASVLGSALAPRPSAPAVSSIGGGTFLGFDSSGWNVNFGSGGITSTATKAEAGSPITQYVAYGFAALAMVLFAKALKK